MVACILLFWIGLQLNAPTWYWILLGVKFTLMICKFTADFIKLGISD